VLQGLLGIPSNEHSLEGQSQHTLKVHRVNLQPTGCAMAALVGELVYLVYRWSFFGKYPAMDIYASYCRGAMAQKLLSLGPGSLRRARQKETMDGLDRTSCGSLFVKMQKNDPGS